MQWRHQRKVLQIQESKNCEISIHSCELSISACDSKDSLYKKHVIIVQAYAWDPLKSGSPLIEQKFEMNGR